MTHNLNILNDKLYALDHILEHMTLPGHIIMTRALKKGFTDNAKYPLTKTIGYNKITNRHIVCPDVAAVVAERRIAWAYYLYSKHKAAERQRKLNNFEWSFNNKTGAYVLTW